MMENIKITGFCRGCLVKFDDPTELLQYTEKNRRLYVYSTGLQVKRNDTFTFQLCKDCYVNMKLACKFKKQCRVSDKRFRQFLALKDEGGTSDFCTFLKTNDDSFMFRFPLMSGNSTPANQRAKDDDNESTCTSIRNFMSDMLRADDIPDAEARIIREVIEEEADVLDDSLDSHWLQDDMSIDNDFRLDFSFSPFSTPRSVNNDRCQTPQKLKESLQNQLQLNNYVLKKILKENSQAKNALKNLEDPAQEKVTSDENHATVDEDNYRGNENHVAIKTECIETEIENNDTLVDNHETAYKGKFYVDNFDDVFDIVENGIDVQKGDETDRTIEKNLEEALKNTDNTDFALKDLLGTPRVFPGASAMSTPTITNILFGEKVHPNLQNGDAEEHRESDSYIEKFENCYDDAEIDILEDFDLQNRNCLESENLEDPVDPWNPLEVKYNMDDFYCNMCKRKFQTARAIKIHAVRIHKEEIPGSKRKKNTHNRVIAICDYCGNKFHDRRALKKHIMLHLNPKQPCKCKWCGLVFTSAAKLRIHVTTHTGILNQAKKDRAFVCNLCSYATTTRYLLTLHMKRHTKSYTHHCEECGKGFYTKSDMEAHARTHNGEKPFECPFCGRKCSRRDTLSRHIKIHLDERPYQCNVCKREFTKEYYLTKHKNNSKKCLKKQEESIVIQLAASSKVTETYYCFVRNEDTTENIVSDTKETSNLSAVEVNDSKILTFDTKLTVGKNQLPKKVADQISTPVPEVMEINEDTAEHTAPDTREETSNLSAIEVNDSKTITYDTKLTVGKDQLPIKSG